MVPVSKTNNKIFVQLIKNLNKISTVSHFNYHSIMIMILEEITLFRFL